MTKANILVVDDDELVLELVQSALESLDYSVTTAENGSEAFEYYNHDSYNIIITDMVMPVVDGIELCRNIRKIDTKIRILIMSGYTKNLKINEVLQNGADSFLKKPFLISELYNAVDKLLKK